MRVELMSVSLVTRDYCSDEMNGETNRLQRLQLQSGPAPAPGIYWHLTMSRSGLEPLVLVSDMINGELRSAPA